VAPLILTDFDYIALKGRESYVVYDSDYATIPQVRQAQDRLAEHLKRKEGKVKVISARPYRAPLLPFDKEGYPQFPHTNYGDNLPLVAPLPRLRSIRIEPSTYRLIKLVLIGY